MCKYPCDARNRNEFACAINSSLTRKEFTESRSVLLDNIDVGANIVECARLCKERSSWRTCDAIKVRVLLRMQLLLQIIRLSGRLGIQFNPCLVPHQYIFTCTRMFGLVCSIAYFSEKEIQKDILIIRHHNYKIKKIHIRKTWTKYRCHMVQISGGYLDDRCSVVD